MRKTIDLLISVIPLIILIVVIFFMMDQDKKANAEEWIFTKEEVEIKENALINKINELENKIHSLPKEERTEEIINERINLEMEKNKVTAFSEAYQLIIDMQQQNDLSYTSTSPGTLPTDFKPIYEAAGERYGVDWSILAAIHKIETQYSGIEVMISSVGAQGHMQFMPGTWAAYGVDGNGDGVKSPWNLEDSIFAAANYLSASGYSKDMRKAIWHYNHAEWYVNNVIDTAATIRGIQ